MLLQGKSASWNVSQVHDSATSGRSYGPVGCRSFRRGDTLVASQLPTCRIDELFYAPAAPSPLARARSMKQPARHYLAKPTRLRFR